MSSENIFSSHWISQTLELPLFSQELSFDAIVTDTRKIQAGNLFLALSGEKFDGNDFCSDAYQKGARGFIVSKKIDLPEDAQVFQVKNTDQALHALGRAWRKRFDFPVIAIAGSVGKTSTKDFLHTLCSNRFGNVLKTENSKNGFLGIPMTLLAMRDTHHMAIIEIGIDDVGTMEIHAETVSPTHVLITSIQEEHLEKLKNLDTVAREECKLFDWGLKNQAHLFIFENDPYCSKYLVHKNSHPMTSYCFQSSPRYEDTVQGRWNSQEQILDIFSREFGELHIKPKLTSSHAMNNLLAACTIALRCGVLPMQLTTVAESIRPSYGRGEILEHSASIRVIHDYYNANPSSMIAAFHQASQLLQSDEDLVLVLGDMLELGEKEKELHEQLSLEIEKLPSPKIYLYGEHMLYLHQVLKQKNIPNTYKKKKLEMNLVLKKEIKTLKKSLVLLKGSRGMRMETFLDEIL